MRILSIDTTAMFIQIALSYQDKFYESHIDTHFDHARELLPAINSLFQQHHIDHAQGVDLIVVLGGPGSFTGLRVGVATARGLATAWDCPLVMVSSLLVYGQGVQDQIYLPCFDARKGRFYASLCCNGKTVAQEADLSPQEIISMCEGYDAVWVTGPGSQALMDSVSMPVHIQLEKSPYRHRAEYAIQLGKEKFLKEGPCQDGDGPIYLRLSDAEINRPR